MPEEAQTLNAEQPGNSSPPATDSGDFVDTIFPPSEEGQQASGETNSSEDADKEPGEKADAKTEDQGEDKGGEEEKEENVPFHKHPRFQELHSKAKMAESRVAELEEQIRNLQQSRGEAESGKKAEVPYRDTSKMTDDEILEWQSEDPKGYYENILKQAKFEISSEFEQKTAQQSEQEAIASTYEKFANEHPDFDELWDSGELKRLMQKRPGYDAINAYWELTTPKLKEQFEAEKEKAIKEAEKKFISDQKAKRQNRVLSAGPSAKGESLDNELKNPDAFGGTTAVLANRLAERRRLRQAGM